MIYVHILLCATCQVISYYSLPPESNFLTTGTVDLPPDGRTEGGLGTTVVSPETKDEVAAFHTPHIHGASESKVFRELHNKPSSCTIVNGSMNPCILFLFGVTDNAEAGDFAF